MRKKKPPKGPKNPDLFDYVPPPPPMPPARAYVRNTDPETSHEAAEAIEPSLKGMDIQILNAVISSGMHGATLSDVMEVTGIQKVSVSPRFKPLETMGHIFRDGKRKGDCRAKQTVWKHINLMNQPERNTPHV